MQYSCVIKIIVNEASLFELQLNERKDLCVIVII